MQLTWSWNRTNAGTSELFEKIGATSHALHMTQERLQQPLQRWEPEVTINVRHYQCGEPYTKPLPLQPPRTLSTRTCSKVNAILCAPVSIDTPSRLSQPALGSLARHATADRQLGTANAPCLGLPQRQPLGCLVSPGREQPNRGFVFPFLNRHQMVVTRGSCFVNTRDRAKGSSRRHRQPPCCPAQDRESDWFQRMKPCPLHTSASGSNEVLISSQPTPQSL